MPFNMPYKPSESVFVADEGIDSYLQTKRFFEGVTGLFVFVLSNL